MTNSATIGSDIIPHSAWQIKSTAISSALTLSPSQHLIPLRRSMADPLASIDGWGSPSASVSTFPAAVHQEPTSHREGNGLREEDDDDAPLSSVLQRPTNAYQNTAAPSVKRTQSSTQQPFLKVRITGLERNRKDLLIRFDANASTPWRRRMTAILIRSLDRPICPTFERTCTAICSGPTWNSSYSRITLRMGIHRVRISFPRTAGHC